MRRTAALLLVTCLVALGACSSSDGDAKVADTAASAAPTTEAPSTPTTAILPCPVDAEASPTQATAETVALPTGVTLMGTQTLYSVDDPSADDVVVRVCGDLAEPAFADLATSFAMALEESARPVASLRVSQWGPRDTGTYDKSLVAVCEDFALYNWTSAPEMNADNWDIKVLSDT